MKTNKTMICCGYYGGGKMQILRGSKREITLMEWDEVLQKAEKKLEESKECYRRFGDEDSKQWIEEDQAKVDKIKKDIEKVNKFMDEHNIQ